MAKNSIYIHFPPELGSLEALYIKSLSHPTALLFHNQESAKAQLTVALLIATQAGAGRFVNDGEAVHFIVDKDGWLHYLTFDYIHSLVLFHIFFKNETSFFNIFWVFNPYNMKSAFIDIKIMISTRKDGSFCFPYIRI